MERSDILIIGGGPGGYEIAARKAAEGCSVTLIEQSDLGGTCLNRGCIPTKCLCGTARTALEIREAAKFGIDTGEVSVDHARAKARMHGIVDGLRNDVTQALRMVKVVKATARILPDGTIEAGGELYAADKVLIATGSAPARLRVEGAELAITSDELLSEGATLPASVVIIGGGVIGIEFASILNALGTEVTVVEFCREILPQFDPDVAKRLRLALQGRGVRFATGASVKSIRAGMEVVYDTRRGEATATAETVLMATGRRPIVPDGTAEAGITLSEHGFIEVDERMRTSREGFYAAGDVTGICMLAHAASAQAEIALSDNAEIDLDIIPSAVFSTPEAAMVGLTADRCAAIGLEHAVGRCNYASNGKALADGATGLVKIVYNPRTRLILGVHVLGEHASDIVAEAAALMYGMVSVDDLASGLIHSHPTLSELLQTAARNATV